MSNQLYRKDLYVNKNINYIFNKTIIEYDIESAGLNLLIKYKLLPEDILDKLKGLPKKKRVVEIGLLQKQYPDLKKQLNDSFIEIRRLFFEENELENDEIISIKKDAIFVTRRLDKVIFDNVKFKEKNIYSSYIRLNSLEFYYNDEKLDIKNLTSDDSVLKLHEDYMINFIKKYFKKMEYGDKEEQLKFIRMFIDKYKRKELEVGYYRTFDRNSIFQVNDNSGISFDEYWEDKKENLDISYNFYRILVPFSKIPL